MFTLCFVRKLNPNTTSNGSCSLATFRIVSPAHVAVSVHRSDDDRITGPKYVGLTLDTLLAEERLRVPRRTGLTKEWRIDLLGGHFHILTDHSTLEHFQTQRTVISRRQARWLDTLAEFDYDLQYLPGRENIVADAMSRYSFPEPLPVIVANISQVSLSDVVKQQIVDAYKTDAFCQQALNNITSVASEFKIIDALLYLRGRLVIPLLAPLRESILHDAHDALGHLGDVKMYQTVIQTYFWPNMSRHVKQYVQQCDSCQRTKARTTRVAGKLHSLPVPVRPMTDIAVDFVGPLPTNKGFDRVLTITDRLSGYVRLIPAREADTAADVANRFHEGWHRFFGLPQRIVSDRDKLFTSKFWSALHKRLNIKLQLSSAFHPETDGRSEKTNKTAFQILRSLVNREQSNWVECLTACEYAINSSVNVSTGKTPFELVLGYTPTLAPLAPIEGDEELPSVEELLALRFQSCEEARDQLAVSKVRQAAQANKDRADEPSWAVGDLVLLDSSDRRKRLHTRKRRAAKLMDRFDGPYRIVAAQPGISTYTLQLNKDDSAVPFFHTGKLKAYLSGRSERGRLNIWSLGFHGRRIAIHGSLPRHWRTRRHWSVGNIGTRNESVFSEGSFVSRRGESDATVILEFSRQPSEPPTLLAPQAQSFQPPLPTPGWFASRSPPKSATNEAQYGVPTSPQWSLISSRRSRVRASFFGRGINGVK
ncbi:BZ3500_MvSof-1268-A1-R1_Chr10-2g02865 [Microbotryum saponariae]|uniref:BZ3500_MvSof-1268-A1-R1_Chr10-2g02865 protein n=1 Tax=Microbotryum saponariae TaxID=289078 RepID=A0A2X0LAG3_9BASI|nr:BZ3501_MvSof-1269-A2-R1_Chr10-2g02451 [Microbotryum saponariae]SDA01638.1 BZ3500_MvSof-1268-A1-R1_Chr10-2g02865 [Microbotryum saponariae]